MPALPPRIELPRAEEGRSETGRSRTPKGKAHEGQEVPEVLPEDADTSPADPPLQPPPALPATQEWATLRRRRVRPTLPRKWKRRASRRSRKVLQKQRVANTPGWFWSRRPRLSPPKSRKSASEAVPPTRAPVWPVVVTDGPIRLHMEFPTCAGLSLLGIGGSRAYHP